METTQTAGKDPQTGTEVPTTDESSVRTKSEPANSGATSLPQVSALVPKADPKPVRQLTPVIETGETQYIMDSARFDQAQRVALTMARSTLTPTHLMRDKSGAFTLEQVCANCFRVVNQALRWGMDPFAVMDETYFIQGRMGYQGKLVAAVVNTRAGLKGRLSATYEGAGDSRKVIVSGTFQGETEPRTAELTVGQAKTEGNAMWKKDPDQKLYYSAVVRFARRHCPEVILGVSIVEDLETIAEETPIGTVTIKTELDLIQDRAYAELGRYTGSDRREWAAKMAMAKRSSEPVEWWENAIAHIAPPER